MGNTPRRRQVSRNFESLYSHTRARSALFATHNTEESLTQQGDAAEADINVIMKRYGGNANGLPAVIGQALSGDFTNVGDYRSMVETIQAADAAFQLIPADIRGRFLNDPQKFIEFATNKDNLEELRKMGLAPPAAPPPKEPDPIKVIVTNPEPTP